MPLLICYTTFWRQLLGDCSSFTVVWRNQCVSPALERRGYVGVICPYESWAKPSVTVSEPDLGGRTWLRFLFPKHVSKLGWKYLQAFCLQIDLAWLLCSGWRWVGKWRTDLRLYMRAWGRAEERTCCARCIYGCGQTSAALGFTLPDMCREGKCSSSFHCFLLEPQAKQPDADRCLNAAKTLSYL